MAQPGLHEFPHPGKTAHLCPPKQGEVTGHSRPVGSPFSQACELSERWKQKPVRRLLQSPSMRQQGPPLGWWLENQKGFITGGGDPGKDARPTPKVWRRSDQILHSKFITRCLRSFPRTRIHSSEGTLQCPCHNAPDPRSPPLPISCFLKY